MSELPNNVPSVQCQHSNVQRECHIPGACQVLPPVCLDCGALLDSGADIGVTFSQEPA